MNLISGLIRALHITQVLTIDKQISIKRPHQINFTDGDSQQKNGASEQKKYFLILISPKKEASEEATNIYPLSCLADLFKFAPT